MFLSFNKVAQDLYKYILIYELRITVFKRLWLVELEMISIAGDTSSDMFVSDEVSKGELPHSRF